VATFVEWLWMSDANMVDDLLGNHEHMTPISRAIEPTPLSCISLCLLGSIQRFIMSHPIACMSHGHLRVTHKAAWNNFLSAVHKGMTRQDASMKYCADIPACCVKLFLLGTDTTLTARQQYYGSAPRVSAHPSHLKFSTHRP
jgi:hypothetical protein